MVANEGCEKLIKVVSDIKLALCLIIVNIVVSLKRYHCKLVTTFSGCTDYYGNVLLSDVELFETVHTSTFEMV